MRIQVIIKPNAKHREEVVQVDVTRYMVYTKAPAVEGRANQAAVALLARSFGVRKSAVTLVRGYTSKIKIFEIRKET